MLRNKLIKILALAALGVTLMACPGAVMSPNDPAQLTIAGTANKNSNRGFPVAVRVYALSSDHLFYGYDFFSLTLDAESVLGVTLKGVLEEMYLEPGSTEVYGPYDVPRNTRFIGVVAAFQNIDNSRWRDTVAVNDRGVSEQVYVAVDGNNVSIMSKAEYDAVIAKAEADRLAAEEAAQQAADAQAAAQAAAQQAAVERAAAQEAAAQEAAAQRAAQQQAATQQQATQQATTTAQTQTSEEVPLHIWLAQRDAEIRAQQAAEAAQAAAGAQ